MNQVQPVAWYPQPSAYQQMAYNPAAQQHLPQPYFQQPQQMPVLVGRSVQRLDEIKPDDIPMDGRVGYFPLADLSCIVAKQWTNEGSIATVRYIPEAAQKAPESTETTSMQDVIDRLDKIQKVLDELGGGE